MWDVTLSTLPQREVYSISRLNREARLLLEGGFPLLWVEGELSNLAQPSSGHWYFSLKDSTVQVRCAMFRQYGALVRFSPKNGMQVLARARVSLYEGRGEFQLLIEHLELAGDGALREAFERLKQRLNAAGLFAAERKKPLPAWPRCVGVVTSPTGAALQDVLSILQRRAPSVEVIVYAVPVQGADAPPKIVAAVNRAATDGRCDVLIVARGGGSLEDLWAFNTEEVARALYACTIPVVTGIGHEIDITIADFVADRRAATPSAAAELASPDEALWRQRLAHCAQRLHNCWQAYHARHAVTLARLEKLLYVRHPGTRLREHTLRLDELELRLRRAGALQQRHAEARLAAAHARLLGYRPLPRLQHLYSHLSNLIQRLHAAWARTHEQRSQRLVLAARTLHTTSPLVTLERGYAIVRTLSEGKIVRTAEALHPGDVVETQLAVGGLLCRVEKILP